MNHPNNISQELRSLNSDMLLNPIQNPYSVPEGYFEGLAASILARVRNSVAVETAEISPLLSSISKEMPYSVPQGYFEENLEALPSVIGEDLASPVLAYVGKELPFDVPAGYFENQAEQVITQVKQPRGKVISLGMKKLMRVAAAAVVTGILAITGYNYFNGVDIDPLAIDPATTNTIATNVEKELKTIPTKELDAFIKNVDVNLNNSVVSNNSSGTEDVRDLLKDVSTTEMDNFLQDVPTADEELFVID